MPAVAPYIPAKQADLNNWASNFSTLITAAPATYGLVAADATLIAAAFNSWHTAYLLAINPSTKTPTTVAGKNTQKVNMLSILRPYAQTISLNAGVSSANKTALGVNPRTSTPTPITAPTTTPDLTAVSTSTAGTIMRWHDSIASPTSKAKPFGAICAEIAAMPSTTPVTDPNALVFQGIQTKSPFTLSLGSGDAGKIIYIAARWLTRTGLKGPWSAIINTVVGG